MKDRVLHNVNLGYVVLEIHISRTFSTCSLNGMPLSENSAFSPLWNIMYSCNASFACLCLELDFYKVTEFVYPGEYSRLFGCGEWKRKTVPHSFREMEENTKGHSCGICVNIFHVAFFGWSLKCWRCSLSCLSLRCWWFLFVSLLVCAEILKSSQLRFW